ncbi:glycosyl transferase, partial [Candidatus Woesearchaeota archaeon CG10_big_fil_rev_8_21_14_0_10_34_8]
MTNILYNTNLTDMETCYKVMTKEVIDKIRLMANRFEIEVELTTEILK